jgi:LemA protein
VLTLVSIGVMALLLVLSASAMLIGLVQLRGLVRSVWGQIGVDLEHRHDLATELVETMSGFAADEAEAFAAVRQARSAAVSGGRGPAAAAQSEDQLGQTLGRLTAASEAYPDLSSNADFVAVEQELTSTGDRISASRDYYNACVRELNTKVGVVPTSILAKLGKIGPEEYFETGAST